MSLDVLADWCAGHWWFGAIVLFLLGVCAGSFLSVCIYRIPLKLSVRTPPSYCPECKAQLTAFDLVPVLSWLWLKGRCRHCGKKISPRYLIVELLTGALFVLCWWRAPDFWKLLPALALTYVLVGSAFIDAENSIIPNGIVIFGAAAGLILDTACYAFTGHMPWQNASSGHVSWLRAMSGAFAGALAGGGPLLALDMLSRVILRKDGMGGGDVKLMAMAGLYLGWSLTFLALILAVLAGGLLGVVFLVTGRMRRGDYFPFGPFLAAGSLASLLFGGNIQQLYSEFYKLIVAVISG